MDYTFSYQLTIVLAMTLVIHVISTLSYAVRIVGARTRRVAVTASLFNILILVSRSAYTFQAPFLAKIVEQSIADGTRPHLVFRAVLFTASIATLIGIAGIPTFQRLFGRAVEFYLVERSLFSITRRVVSPQGWQFLCRNLTLPVAPGMAVISKTLRRHSTVLLANTCASALLTTGVLSALYAGYLVPDFRVTCSSLSALVNGFATILMFALIDPHLSVHTEDVLEGKMTESDFRRLVSLMVLSRFGGTLLAQVLFLPGAHVIARLASII